MSRKGGHTHPWSYSPQYGTSKRRRYAHTSEYDQLMIGFTRTKRGHPGSVGFRKPSLATVDGMGQSSTFECGGQYEDAPVRLDELKK